jgi:copper transport protein
VKLRLLAALAVVLALAAPGNASAHARLVSTSPANGAVVVKAPAAVRVVFDDVIRAGPGIEAIRNGGGSVLGTPHVEHQHVLVLPLRSGLPHGDYSVRWSIVSDDGHLESGVIAFAVGTDALAPTAALAAEGTGPRAADVVARWLFYAGLLGAVGTALFALLARPRDDERVALVISSLAVVAAIGGGEEAHRAGLDTRAGTALGAAALTAVVVATLAGAATLDRRILRPTLLLALLLVVPPAFAGHAYDTGVNRINVAADALHIAGASAWIGALIGLVVFRAADRRRAALLALGGVLVLSATGVIRAWSELLRVSQLWDTSYGNTLLVKTGALLAVISAGLLLRHRIRERAGVELALAAGLVVAVSVLVLLAPGRNFASLAPVRVSTAEPSPPPPLPGRGAVTLAQELGELGVAVELEPKRTTAIVLSPGGGGLNGLAIHLNGIEARPCGQGCYRTEEPPGASVAVQIDRFGPTLRTTFDVPATTSPGDALLRRVEDRYRTLRSVFYLERLASSPAHAITALWRLEYPDRLEYQIPNGAAGIVIGNRRWDRATPDAAWQESAQTRLPQPATLWSSIANVHVVASDPDTKTLTFVDPETPAFFEAVIDVHTLLPRTVRMTASAHFMVDRYVRFNAPRAIHPPR